MSLEIVKWQTERVFPTCIEIRVLGVTVLYSLVRFGKPFFPPTKLHGFTFQNTVISTVMAMWAPDITSACNLLTSCFVLALRELLSVPCRFSRSSPSNRSNGKSFVCLLEYEGSESLFLHSTRLVTSCEHWNSDARYFFLPNLYS